MEINYNTMKKYIEERFFRYEEKGIAYYYDMRGKVAAIDENNIITLYYDAPKEIVETQYGKLAVSIIDNFKVGDTEKTTLINAIYVTHVTENRNNIKVENQSIVVPKFNFELYEKRYSLGTIGTLEQDENNKYHLTNDDFDIEFETKRILEPNAMDDFKILVIKELAVTENKEDPEALNLKEVYNFYHGYFKSSRKTPIELAFQIRPRITKSYDVLEKPVITTKKQEKTGKQQRVKQYILK